MLLSRRKVVIGASAGLLLAGALWLASTLLLPKTSVPAAFDNPPQWPGYTWTRNGHQASHEEIASSAGPSHCDWQTATFLNLGWPLGSRSISSRDSKRFVRDPNGVVSRTYQQQWLEHATLPKDAYSTGYLFDAIALYLSDSDPDGAYLVAPQGTERWPLASDFKACA
jgi:hypothetical protein